MFNELPPYLVPFQPGASFRFAMLRITRCKSAHVPPAVKGCFAWAKFVSLCVAQNAIFVKQFFTNLPFVSNTAEPAC